MAEEANFLLVGTPTAQSMRAGSELVGMEASKLLGGLDQIDNAWESASVSPADTWLVVDHQSARASTVKTLALHLGIGDLPPDVLKARIRRESSDPFSSAAGRPNTGMSLTNFPAAVETALRNDPYTAPSWTQPTVLGSQAIAQMTIPDPGSLVTGANLQLLVFHARRSDAGGNPTLKVEVNGDAGFVEIGSAVPISAGLYGVRFDATILGDYSGGVLVKLTCDPESGENVELASCRAFFTVTGVPIHDSGWFDLVQSVSALTGSGDAAINDIGESRPLQLSYDFRDDEGLSEHVDARYTVVEFDVHTSPGDLFTTIGAAFGTQYTWTMSWHYYVEGPGLAGMFLQKGIEVTVRDLSTVKLSTDGYARAVLARVIRSVSFNLGELPETIGPQVIEQLFFRVGNTAPLIFVVLPEVASLRQAFSLCGLVTRDFRLKHVRGKITSATIALREL